MRETCATCRYFHPPSGKVGVCRRHAPMSAEGWRFPPVDADERCGDWTGEPLPFAGSAYVYDATARYQAAECDEAKTTLFLWVGNRLAQAERLLARHGVVFPPDRDPVWERL